MQTEYYQSRCRIDLYFRDYRRAIEVDEFDQCNRDIEYQKEREIRLKEDLNCAFIKINPDEEFSLF